MSVALTDAECRQVREALYQARQTIRELRSDLFEPFIPRHLSGDERWTRDRAIQADNDVDVALALIPDHLTNTNVYLAGGSAS